MPATRRQFLAGTLATAALRTGAQTPRPRITGISHAGFYVSNLDAALDFWHDLLGYDIYWRLPRPNENATRIAFVKINDRQHIELFTDTNPHPPNQLSHICFTTDSAAGMLAYLRANGITTPAAPGKTKAGDLAFEVKDPQGMLVEFVEHQKDGQETVAKGKFLPTTRIGASIYHLGFLVGDLTRAQDFYGRILGFTEIWRGTPPTSAELSWVNMKLPNDPAGVDDYVEFMLYSKPVTDSKNFGTKNHVAIAVDSIDTAAATIRERANKLGYDKPITPATGVNRKRQLNLYDPDGTRVELMETHTIDGKPTPPSSAPPPQPQPS